MKNHDNLKQCCNDTIRTEEQRYQETLKWIDKSIPTPKRLDSLRCSCDAILERQPDGTFLIKKYFESESWEDGDQPLFPAS